MEQPQGENHPSPVVAPPIVPGQIPSRPSQWPTVLGIISIVLGSLGILGSLWQIIGSAIMPMILDRVDDPQGQVAIMRDFMVFNIVIGLASLALAILLLVSGIALHKRRPSGPRLSRLWAILKMCLGVAAAVVQVMMQSRIFAQQQATAAPPMMMNMIIIFTVIFTILWIWAYPVFLLIWLSRARIKQETAAWS